MEYETVGLDSDAMDAARLMEGGADVVVVGGIEQIAHLLQGEMTR
ncbi:hypothetical protein [Streptomyces sp. NBC_01217]|nr:hypothetical protein OG507_31645 [Streptomyces sp. NBC_01217]